MTALANTIDQCPWCGEHLEDAAEIGDEDADNFCTHCGAPLFWTSGDGATVASTATDDGGDAAREDTSRRSPAVRGVHSDASIACWNCGEPNPQAPGTCHRCGADIPELEQTVDTRPGATAAVRGAWRIPEPIPWELPAPVLVALGIVLVAVVIRLIGIAW